MFSELTTSVKAKLYDYVSSSFLTTFSIISLFYNKEYLMYYFSSDKLEIKSQYLSHTDFNIIIPLGISLVYILLYPKIEYYLATYTIKEKEKLLKEKQKIKNDELLTVEKSRKIKMLNINLENELIETKEGYKELRDGLNTTLKKELEPYITKEKEHIENNNILKESIQNAKNTNQKISKEMEKLKLKIEKLEAHNYVLSDNEIAQKYELTEKDFNFLKKEIINKNFSSKSVGDFTTMISSFYKVNQYKAAKIRETLIEKKMFAHKAITGGGSTSNVYITVTLQELGLDIGNI